MSQFRATDVGTRAPYFNGNSLVLTLPKSGIEDEGIDVVELAGSECQYELVDGVLTVDLRGGVE